MPFLPYFVLESAKLQVQNLPDLDKSVLSELFRGQDVAKASAGVGDGKFVVPPRHTKRLVATQPKWASRDLERSRSKLRRDGVSLFKPLRWSLAEAEAELLAFKTWFLATTFVGEPRSQPLSRRGAYARPSRIQCRVQRPRPNSIQAGLARRVRTDPVLGKSVTRQFALVEFEAAEENSIFSKRRTGQYRHWSRALEHGFGQVIDWGWIMNDHRSDVALTNAFEGTIHASAYLVVCGRDAGLRNEM